MIEIDWKQHYTTIAITIIVLIVLWLLFKNSGAEKFTMTGPNGLLEAPDILFNTYEDGEKVLYTKDNIFYGADGKTGVIIPETTMNRITQNGQNPFSCWPGGPSGGLYNGLPSLPINDPDPGIPKKCYVFKTQPTTTPFNADQQVDGSFSFSSSPSPTETVTSSAQANSQRRSQQRQNLATRQAQSCNTYDQTKTLDDLRKCINAENELSLFDALNLERQRVSAAWI